MNANAATNTLNFMRHNLFSVKPGNTLLLGLYILTVGFISKFMPGHKKRLPFHALQPCIFGLRDLSQDK
ncbi:hypothetical protein GCM10011450_02230 [Advenella faeciporci]|uniref:Uncharacterized protein n=1 Tax=Advenella faeciporci TaxID=797535 RepID=A0A918JEB3_9BURK|nr:hypothetical protein GCM10011450_02230 [Advenella faeciporci]